MRRIRGLSKLWPYFVQNLIRSTKYLISSIGMEAWSGGEGSEGLPEHPGGLCTTLCPGDGMSACSQPLCADMSGISFCVLVYLLRHIIFFKAGREGDRDRPQFCEECLLVEQGESGTGLSTKPLGAVLHPHVPWPHTLHVLFWDTAQ